MRFGSGTQSTSRPLQAAVLTMLFLLNASPGAHAGQPTTTAYAALFGSTNPNTRRIVVQRDSPWRETHDRVTPQLLDTGKTTIADATATIVDASLIESFFERLRRTPADAEGCEHANFTARTMPVSWAIFFYKNPTDQHKQAALYITKDGLCASNGTALYFIYPELRVYLERTFSFMNF